MNDFIELRRVMGTIRHRWWLLILLPIIYGGLGFLASKTQMPVYTATTTMLAGDIINASDLNRQDIAASDLMAITYKEMIQRQPVMQGVVQELGLNQTWQTLRRQVRVEVVEGTQLLQITVEASSPEAAQKIADEVANQLILYTPTVFRNVENEDVMLFVQQQLTNLQDRIAQGHSRMTALESAMVTTTSAERLSELQAEAKTLEGLIADWENNYTQLLLILQSKKDLNKLTIIEAAQANPRPIRPKPEIYVLVGVGVAFFLALVLIFLMDHIENIVRSRDEITQDFGLQVLGTIAKEPRKKKTGVYVSEYPNSAIAEAYRSLRAQLEMIETDQPLKKILITSCDKEVGKTSVAANLATIIGQGEKDVILVDADLRNSSIHNLMELPNDVGLSDIILNGKEISEAIQEYPGGNVRVITGGTWKTPPGKPGPFEALGSKKMESILDDLGKDNDVIILDTPPLIVSDALLLSTKVDGVLLVVQLGQTRRKYIRAMLEQLARANARVVGVVLNQMSPKGAQNFGDTSYYYNEYSDAQESNNEAVDEKEDKRGLVAAGRERVKSFFARPRKSSKESLETDYESLWLTSVEPGQETDERYTAQVETPEPTPVDARQASEEGFDAPESVPLEAVQEDETNLEAQLEPVEPIPAEAVQASEEGVDTPESVPLEAVQEGEEKVEDQVEPVEPIKAEARQEGDETLVAQVEPPEPKALSSNKKGKKTKRRNSNKPVAIQREIEQKDDEKPEAQIVSLEPTPADTGQAGEAGLNTHESYVLERGQEDEEQLEAQVEPAEPIQAEAGEVSEAGTDAQVDTLESFFVKPGNKRETDLEAKTVSPEQDAAQARDAGEESSDERLDEEESFFLEPGQDFIELTPQRVSASSKK